MQSAGPLHVVYDGQCAFCVRVLRFCRMLDRRERLRFQDAHDRAAVEARFPALRGAALDDAMYVVGPGDEVHCGFFAFRRIVRGIPLMWPLLPLFYAPGARLVGPSLYAWVAHHRHHFGCRADGCRIAPSLESRASSRRRESA